MDLLNNPAALAAGVTRPRPHRWLALILLCAANFMVILDAQVVILAVPAIATALHIGATGAQWVVSANLIAFGGLLLLGGRLADLLGRRRIFMLGTGLLLVVSLACGLATSGGLLIVLRVLHGVAAALMAPTALSILTTTFPEGPERNKALAGWAGIAGIGATAALLLGGALTAGLGWRWVFLINVPVAAVMLVLSPLLLAESRDQAAPRRYDVAGAVTSTLALAALVTAVGGAPANGWLSAPTIGMLAAAVVLVVVFVAVERRARTPLVPLHILRSPWLAGGNLATVAMGMGAFGLSMCISLYTQTALGYSPLEFGLRQAPMPLMAFLGAFAGQGLIARFGARAVTAGCALLMALGDLLLVGVVHGGSSYGSLLLALVVFGLGLGLGTTAASAAALSGVGSAEAGIASGFNAAALQVGGALGIAISATLIVAGGPGTGGFAAGFAGGAVFGIVAFVLAVAVIPGRRRARAGAPQPTPSG